MKGPHLIDLPLDLMDWKMVFWQIDKCSVVTMPTLKHEIWQLCTKVQNCEVRTITAFSILSRIWWLLFLLLFSTHTSIKHQLPSHVECECEMLSQQWGILWKAKSSKLTVANVRALFAALAKLQNFCLDCSNNLCKHNYHVLEELETNKLNFSTNEYRYTKLERDGETYLTVWDLMDCGYHFDNVPSRRYRWRYDHIKGILH